MKIENLNNNFFWGVMSGTTYIDNVNIGMKYCFLLNYSSDSKKIS